MRLYELAKSAASCDSLQQFQDRLIQRSLKIEAAKDSIIVEQNGQLLWTRASLGEAGNIIEAQKGLTKVEKRKKRRWMLVAGGLLVVWVTTEVLTE